MVEISYGTIRCDNKYIRTNVWDPHPLNTCFSKGKTNAIITISCLLSLIHFVKRNVLTGKFVTLRIGFDMSLAFSWPVLWLSFYDSFAVFIKYPLSNFVLVSSYFFYMFPGRFVQFWTLYVSWRYTVLDVFFSLP